MQKFSYFSLLTGALLLVACQKNKDWMDYSPIDMYSANVGYDDSKAPYHLNVAAASIQPSKTDKNQTIQTINQLVTEIKSVHPEVDVIVFGELILEWYFEPSQKGAYQRQMAELIPGPSTLQISQIAAANNVSIIVGMTEEDSSTNNTIFNSQVLIYPNGEIRKYRKRNLNETDKENGFTPGEEAVNFDFKTIPAMLFICSDMQSLSLTKEVAASTAKVIFQSLTSTTDLNPSTSYVGTQLNKWIVFANRCGQEGDVNYTGFTHIISPVGTICERKTGTNCYVYRRIGLF